MSPFVSIIVPVFNTERYLNACLGSILKQSFSDLELILIDDGSSDGSGVICDSFAREDLRVSVFHTDNKGVSSARNLGLDHAKGVFVMFVDSDDLLPEDALEIMALEMADFSVGGMLRIVNGRNLEYRHRADKLYQKEEKERFIDDAFPVSVLMEAPSAKLYRMSIIRQNGLRFNENIHYGEDKIFVYSFLLYAETLRTVTGIVYIQKRRDGSLSSDITSPNHLKPLIDFLTYYVSIVKKFETVFSCRTVRNLYSVDVIQRYVFRYLNIVRANKLKNLSQRDLFFISSLLKRYKSMKDGRKRNYINSCVWIGKNLPDVFLYWFILLLNHIR